ncbi:hypothetical protein Tco_1078988 [Tanacetum coccineum]|uniref:Uncharacterized protein n=1 Tax=Tanacetum coccineum TaxID=301880 RepID=A0ABQ5HSL5_9ASTR
MNNQPLPMAGKGYLYKSLDAPKGYGLSVVMMSLIRGIKCEHGVVNRIHWNEVSPSPSLLDPVIKQLAIKLVDEYGFVIRPSLVGLTSGSVRTDL